MALPIGSIYTTNITPDKTYGIGRFSLAEFDRALRLGVSNGHSLDPAMPYPSYAIITRGDVAALYAYLDSAWRRPPCLTKIAISCFRCRCDGL
jgi:hypothetical protein